MSSRGLNACDESAVRPMQNNRGAENAEQDIQDMTMTDKNARTGQRRTYS